MAEAKNPKPPPSLKTLSFPCTLGFGPSSQGLRWRNGSLILPPHVSEWAQGRSPCLEFLYAYPSPAALLGCPGLGAMSQKQPYRPVELAGRELWLTSCPECYLGISPHPQPAPLGTGVYSARTHAWNWHGSGSQPGFGGWGWCWAGFWLQGMRYGGRCHRGWRRQAGSWVAWPWKQSKLGWATQWREAWWGRWQTQLQWDTDVCEHGVGFWLQGLVLDLGLDCDHCFESWCWICRIKLCTERLRERERERERVWVVKKGWLRVGRVKSNKWASNCPEENWATDAALL